jgi:hypothetical protein
MVNIGMIFQYDAELGSGLVMLSGGEQKTFNKVNWVDKVNEPSVGLKISYDDSGRSVQIKMANEEDKISPNSVEEEPQEIEVEEELSPLEHIKALETVDAYVEYYVDMGFKLVKDSIDEDVRTANLRLYTPSDYGEATITQDASKLSVVQSINGKKITTS